MYTMDFAVLHSHLGADGFMRPSLLLAAVQDAATEDAERHMDMGRQAMRERFGAFWIIARTSLYIDRPLEPGGFRAVTWRAEGHGALWPRATVVLDGAGRVAARCISQWSAISWEEPRRVVLLPDIPADEPPYPLPRVLRPRVPASAPVSGSHTVVRSDLDENRHVNNARALDILEDAVRRDAPCGEGVLREAHIHYAGEARLGDVLTVRQTWEGRQALLRTAHPDGRAVHEAALVYASAESGKITG